MSNLKSVRKSASPVTVELNGETQMLKYDLNAFAELETIYGSVTKAMAAMEKGSLKAVINVLWAGLIHDKAELDPVTGEPIRYTLTKHTVGSWVDPTDLEYISERLTKALGGDSPDKANETKAEETGTVPNENLPQ